MVSSATTTRTPRRCSRKAPSDCGESVGADDLGAERFERGRRGEVGEPHVEALDPAFLHRMEVVEQLAPTADDEGRLILWEAGTGKNLQDWRLPGAI